MARLAARGRGFATDRKQRAAEEQAEEHGPGEIGLVDDAAVGLAEGIKRGQRLSAWGSVRAVLGMILCAPCPFQEADLGFDVVEVDAQLCQGAAPNMCCM